MIDFSGMPSATDDPIGSLHACHRRFQQVLRAVEAAAARERERALTDAEREALSQELQSLHAAVALHAADETESLFPRLRTALTGRAPSVLLALKTVEWGHAVAGGGHW